MEEILKITSESVGSIIGKGGSKIKEIQQKSGAKCFVDGNNLFVKIRGSSQQIKIAKDIIQEIMHNSIIVYSHPEKVYSILCHPNITKNSIVEFQKFYGSVENPDRNETFYILSFIEKTNEELDLSSLSIKEPKFKTFYLEKDLVRIQKELVDITFEKKLKKLKHVVMVTFGTTTFYESRKFFKKSMGINELLNSSIGVNEDFKSKYHSIIDKEFADKMVNFLVDELKFKKKEIHGITFHMVDTNLKERISLSLKKDKDGKIIEKIFTSEQNKHIFINMLYNLEYDFRLLYYTKDYKEITKELENFIKEYEKNPNSEFNLKLYKLDIVREHKGFELSNDQYKISIYKITNMENTRYEVQIENIKVIESFEENKNISKEEMLKLVSEMSEFSKSLLKFKENKK